MAGFFTPDDILEARRDTEELMLDTCRIERQGASVTDPHSGVVTPSLTLVYQGRCKVQQTLAQSRAAEAGGAQFALQDTQVQVPVGVGPVQTDDLVTMLTSAYNPALAGNIYRVTELFEKSFQTAQRLRAEEMT